MSDHSWQACGKFILAGEHFILHDTAALALPWYDITLTLHPRSEADGSVPHALVVEAWQAARQRFSLPKEPGFPFRIESQIPQGSGFGSSAAFCLCLLQAAAAEAGTTLDVPALIEEATALEALFHGRSSGLDPAVVATRQPLRFVMGQAPIAFPWQLEGYGFVLATTGEERQTSKAVAQVHAYADAHPGLWTTMTAQVRDLVDTIQALSTGDTSLVSLDLMGMTDHDRAVMLGQQLDLNHRLLAQTGISTKALDRYVETARTHGALGAKLTGAGLGGGMLAFGPQAQLAAIREALLHLGAPFAALATPMLPTSLSPQ